MRIVALVTALLMAGCSVSDGPPRVEIAEPMVVESPLRDCLSKTDDSLKREIETLRARNVRLENLVEVLRKQQRGFLLAND